MSQMSVIPPPSGTIPNFDDPPSQKGILLIVNGTSISLMMICSALQIYTKIFVIETRFGFEEGKCMELSRRGMTDQSSCKWLSSGR